MDGDSKQPAEHWSVLGLSAGASAEQVRAAYVEKVKQFPPDRAPAEFERVRDAYDALRDPRRRALASLFEVNPAAPLVDALAAARGKRRHVGPGPWLAVLREGRR